MLLSLVAKHQVHKAKVVMSLSVAALLKALLLVDVCLCLQALLVTAMLVI